MTNILLGIIALELLAIFSKLDKLEERGRENDTDFINIKCFGRTAEWAQKWLSKGSRAEVTGKIKTGSYESQRTGSKVYYTEVVANSVGFGESKAEAEARGQQLPESDGFMNIPEGADEELPFN